VASTHHHSNQLSGIHSPPLKSTQWHPLTTTQISSVASTHHHSNQLSGIHSPPLKSAQWHSLTTTQISSVASTSHHSNQLSGIHSPPLKSTQWHPLATTQINLVASNTEQSLHYLDHLSGIKFYLLHSIWWLAWLHVLNVLHVMECKIYFILNPLPPSLRDFAFFLLNLIVLSATSELTCYL
jgi:hypothetical protein